MSSQNVQIVFNVSGNATTAMALEKNIANTTNIFKSFGGGIVVTQQFAVVNCFQISIFVL